jgi:hypothetical protein|tara:strand:+ start:186 stop:386 length:201 start_codon:yes stop_codon:yes gene_type:complete
MKFWIIVIFYTFLFGAISLSMFGCSHKIEPNQTTIEYGTSENGKNKVNKTIKQTWKWSKVKKLISP